ncbi:MAG: hypothetical protein C4538_04360 [Nitrospiraceae bacterium]|nr:MAG: hypothetical protein C4538_04360 [Nitrospiraceae bacterium]
MNDRMKAEGIRHNDARRFRFQFILQLALIHCFAWHAYSFTTAAEYQSHLKGAESCTSVLCHQNLAKGKMKYEHRPSGDGKCAVCHTAEAYPGKYGLEPNQSITCTDCHKHLNLEIQTSKYIHGPIKNGDCTSCHDPHGSDIEFILKKTYSQLCSQCHSLKGLYSGKLIHKPVEDGNCGLCHDPHASNFRARLTDVGANLCLLCHEDMVPGMTQKYVHAPLLKNGCTDCHDPHSGNDKLRLKTEASRLCFTCHEEKKNEVAHYTRKHKPAAEGQCISCHSPHFSESKHLLRGKIDALCYACHKDKAAWGKRQFLHGPLVQGNCVACHNPHGSDNAFILRLEFPYKFYTNYERGKYDLCFQCHKEALVTTENTKTVTNFRNGEVNLHMLHVRQEKGRNCRACHDVHASDQEYHIREEFPFGSVNIPMYYYKTSTGGRCIPGCHKERSYDRHRAVENRN